MFTKNISKFQFQPEVELFASRPNVQLPVFASYHLDLENLHINAFSISWQGRHFYAFPPFAIIGKVLHKIVFDVATWITVVRNWPRQQWYSLLMKLLIDIPILLCSSKILLQHPSKIKTYSLANKLNLLACMISDKTQEQQTFEKRAFRLSSKVGNPREPKDMTTTLKNRKCFVVKGVLIPFQHLSIEFLTKIFESGVGYSSADTAGSALSSVLIMNNEISFGKHPLIQCFIKGIFNLRPTLPRQIAEWDPDIVLDYLSNLEYDLPLKDLSEKLIILLCLSLYKDTKLWSH